MLVLNARCSTTIRAFCPPLSTWRAPTPGSLACRRLALAEPSNRRRTGWRLSFFGLYPCLVSFTEQLVPNSCTD